MYVITGASGNTGSMVAHRLLDAGMPVRVLGRNSDHLRPFKNRGAEAMVVDLTDSSRLANAFRGAQAVYVMIPPNPSAPDVLDYDARITEVLVSALKAAEVTHVVSLSSFGADKSTGTGLVLGLHRLEAALDAVEGLNTLHLRAGYFMENTLAQAEIIRETGGAAGPLRGDLKLPMIASQDIGAVAAEVLKRLDFRGHQTCELHGQRDLSYDDATSILGRAIGKPELRYTLVSGEHLRSALERIGMSASFAGLLLQMADALNSGHMCALEPRKAENTTSTPYESFVSNKFLPAYHRLEKAA